MKRTLNLAFAVLATLALIPAHARSADAPPDLNRIRVLLQMGRAKEALPLAETAARSAPENAAAQLLHGKALAAVEKPKEAIAAMKAAIALDGKDAAALVALGDTHFLQYGVQMRDWLKKHRYASLGQIDAEVMSARPGPGNTTSLIQETMINDRSTAQMNGREWEDFRAIAKDALTAYDAALALEPDNKAATRGKGLAHLVLGEWKKTADAFQAAGAPPFDSFVFELARNIYDARTMGDDAMRLWASVEQSDPTNPWAYWYQRALYDEFRHSDWRYGYFDAMVKLHSDVLRDEGDARKYTPKDAMKALEAINTQHPEFAPAWRGRGIAAVALKDRKLARTAFEKAASLDETDWFSNLQLGVNLLNERKGTEAQAALGKAAKGNPLSAVSWHTLGLAAELNKDLDSAVSYYERAADLAPGWGEAHYSLGALLLDRRQGAQALPHLERYLELDPKGKNVGEVKSAVDQLKKMLAAS